MIRRFGVGSATSTDGRLAGHYSIQVAIELFIVAASQVLKLLMELRRNILINICMLRSEVQAGYNEAKI